MSPGRPSLDGARIERRGRALAFPRYPGTEGDRRAIEMVEGWLRAAGLEVSRQPFDYDVRPAFRALRLLLVADAVLVAGAGLGAGRSPLAAAAALLVALAAGGVFLVWAPGLERIYRAGGPTRTANVEGRLPVADPRLTLILLAHHDSKSQNLTLPFRLGLTIAAIGGALTLAVLLAAALWRGAPPGPGWLPAAAGLASAAALLVLSTLSSGNRSPGGVDNAGSVAIVAELAEALPPRLPQGVELVCLSPGAEEDHMVGAMRWLDARLPDLAGRPVYALNLDGAGIPGRVTLLERYGAGRLFSERLSRLARRAAGELGIRVRGVLLPPAMGVDAIPFAHRGVECLTLASGSLCRATLAVHSPGDRGENLDRGALERVALLAAGILERLAVESGENERGPGRGPRK